MLERASDIPKYFRNRTFGRSTGQFQNEIEASFPVLGSNKNGTRAAMPLL